MKNGILQRTATLHSQQLEYDHTVRTTMTHLRPLTRVSVACVRLPHCTNQFCESTLSISLLHAVNLLNLLQQQYQSVCEPGLCQNNNVRLFALAEKNQTIAFLQGGRGTHGWGRGGEKKKKEKEQEKEQRTKNKKQKKKRKKERNKKNEKKQKNEKTKKRKTKKRKNEKTKNKKKRKQKNKENKKTKKQLLL